MDAVINKILSAIDVAHCGEQALARMRIADRGPVEDRGSSVDTILLFETGAAVLDFLVAVVKNWGCQTSNNLAAIQVSKYKKNHCTIHSNNLII
jgi:hypothetical protein